MELWAIVAGGGRGGGTDVLRRAYGRVEGVRMMLRMGAAVVGMVLMVGLAGDRRTVAAAGQSAEAGNAPA